MDELLLVDASSSIFRAFHAIPDLRSAAGVPTNAVLGFATMLQKVLRERAPRYAAVAWDSAGPRRRSQTYADYKATRDATPEDLRAQLGYIRRLVAAYRIPSFECAGEEADDVIATLVARLASERVRVCIVSTDKDLMQLVSERVVLLDTMRDRAFGPAEVIARFGVPPERMLDLRALVGDPSDNIPGVKGIGEKGAAALLAAHGSLDAILAHVDEVTPARARNALASGAEAARLSWELSRLTTDLPLAVDLPSLRLQAPDKPGLAELFAELDLRRLLDALGPDAARPVAPAAPALAVQMEHIADAAGARRLAERMAGIERLGVAGVLGSAEPMTAPLLGLALAEAPESAVYVSLEHLEAAGVLEALCPLLEADGRRFVGPDLKALAVSFATRGLRLGGTLADIGVTAYVADPSQNVAQLASLAKAYLGAELPLPPVPAQATLPLALRPASEAMSLDGNLACEASARTPAPDEVPSAPAPAAMRVPPGADVAGVAATYAAHALALDVAIESQLTPVQRALLSEIERPLTRVLAGMELAGVRIDGAALAALGTELARDLARIEQEVYLLAGEPFNIGSPKQLQYILFEKLGLPATKKTKTGYSTDESVLEELSLQYALPRAVLDYRKLAKLKSTYVDALPRLVNPRTRRIHGSFNQTVAATGRLSSSNPNLQNIPVRTPQGQRIREAFIPADGAVLLSADYSQIELRILAHLSEDPVLVAAFVSGDDIHVQTAAHVFGIPPEVVTAEQRSQMKAVNFGIIYGSSAFGLARQLGVPQAVAAAHIRDYFARYPSVRSFLDRTIDQARERGYAETIDGRRRYLPELASRNHARRSAAERMATNSVIQGTAADFIKRAMVRIDAALPRHAQHARLILQVHDELVFEAPPSELAGLGALVRTEMQSVASLRVPLLVHLGSGKSWRAAH
jgi:DNA polymerase-1